MTKIEESRHYRQKRVQRERERHDRIVGILTDRQKVVRDFKLEVESERPDCVTAGIPSEWVDWDSTEEHREFYEGLRPSAERAKALCHGCELLDGKLCERYAEVTNQDHGIWGGRRREKGKWVPDHE